MAERRLRGLIGGMPHSGTTLVANLLTAGGEVFNRFEKGLLLKSEIAGDAFVDPDDDLDRVGHGADYRRFLHDIYGLDDDDLRVLGAASDWYDVYDRFFDLCRSRAEDFPYRWTIDKTPAYGRNLDLVASRVPDTPIVVCYCDPRKLAISVRKRIPDPRAALEKTVELWLEYAVDYKRFSATSDRVLAVRYEDLVRDPETWMRLVCLKFEIPFHPDMVRLDRSADGGAWVNEKIRRDDGIDPASALAYRGVLTDEEELFLLLATHAHAELWSTSGTSRAPGT